MIKKKVFVVFSYLVIDLKTKNLKRRCSIPIEMSCRFVDTPLQTLLTRFPIKLPSRNPGTCHSTARFVCRVIRIEIVCTYVSNSCYDNQFLIYNIKPIYTKCQCEQLKITSHTQHMIFNSILIRHKGANCETLSKCQPMVKGEQIRIVRTTNGTFVEIIVKN